MSGPNSPQLFQAINRGWRIFPVKSKSKAALIKGWPDKATTDKTKISEWIRKYPKCNWGVATGSGSGILVRDVDTDDALNELEKLGSMPRTFTVKTARGHHLYFQYPPNTKIKNSVKQLHSGVDIKGERGYVLLPPSLHPSGIYYEIIDDHPPAPLPRWLLEELAEPSTSLAKVPTEGTRTLIQKKIEEGSRNATLASLAGTMQRRGMARDAIEAALLKENEQRCEPPLPESEVLGVVNSISRYEPAEEKGQQSALIIGERPFAQMVPDAESALKNRF